MNKREASNLLAGGRKAFSAGAYAKAVDAARRLVRFPGFEVDAHALWAASEHRLGNSSAALDVIESVERSVDLSPELLSLKGLALRALGRKDDALQVLKRSTHQFPSHADSWHNLSVVALESADGKLAYEAARKAFRLRPENIETLKQLGRACIQLRNAMGAREAYQRLLQLQDDSPDAHNGLGASYLLDNDPAAAIPHFRHALTLNPNLASSLANLGIASKQVGDYDTASEVLARAVEVEPANPENHWNLALLLLAQGRFEEGWKEYESRYDPARIASDRVPLPRTSIPMLRPGESACGKTVAILHEQGLGDTLQFCRYAKNLKEEGARVVLLVPPPLVPVLATLPWIEVVASGWPNGLQIDAWVFTLSLPHRYGTGPNSIPAPVPYLHATQAHVQRWTKRLGEPIPGERRIGLVWAGRPTHANDRNRSMRLDDFAPLAEIPGLRFYSLQMGDRADEVAPAGMQIERLGPEINDFADTAAILTQLDLLITVDSSPAHIAGAMGSPVWVLVPQISDFRWLLDRTDSPWYPTMRLFRQTCLGQWGNIIDEMKTELSRNAESLSPKAKYTVLLGGQTSSQPCEAGLMAQLRHAVAVHGAGQQDQAIPIYEWVLGHDPSSVDAMRNLAVAYRKSLRAKDAESLYERALALAPDDKILLTNYANLLADIGAYDRAEELARRSLAIDPEQAGAHYIMGLCLDQRDLSEAGWGHACKAMELAPSRADFIALKGLIALKTHRFADARHLLEQAHEAEPGRTDVLNALGQYFQRVDELDAAQDCYDKAEALEPENKILLLNRGTLHAQRGDYALAEVDSRRAIAVAPEFADAHFNLALYLLVQGKFSEGWSQYEWRQHPGRRLRDRLLKPQLTRPEWCGEPLQGKTILLFPEQGFGDSIQFIRYAEKLKEEGATVWIAAHAPLLEILKSCPWVDRVFRDGDSLPPYDYWIFPLSLPHRFRTALDTIPSSVPYLHAMPSKVEMWRARIRDRASPQSKLKVGLVWSGSPSHSADRHRSIPIDTIAPLGAVPGISWFALHKAKDAEESYKLGELSIPNLGVEIGDFSDTAAIIENLDLLISVDSAPVHLAGALSKPCWALLAFNPDFRWLLERRDTPWYPSVTLFRQPSLGDWGSVIKAVAEALNRQISLRAIPERVSLGAPSECSQAKSMSQEVLPSEGSSESRPALGVLRALNDANLPIGLTWQLSEFHGWGVFGMNLVRQMRALDRRLFLSVPPSESVGKIPEFQQLAANWERNRALFTQSQSAPLKIPNACVLHAFGNDFNGASGANRLRGDKNVGFIFFEQALFSRTGLKRGHEMDMVLAGSRWNAEVLRDAGFPRVGYVMQGVDIERFARVKRSPRHSDRFVIFSGGKLEFRKGQDIVLAAFAKFYRRHPDSILVTAWNNPWPGIAVDLEASPHRFGAPRIDEKTNKLDIAEWCSRSGLPPEAFHHLDFIPNGSLEDVYSLADAAVFPNRAEGGTNLVAMELMSCGVPCLVAVNTGQKDIVTTEGCLPLRDQKAIEGPNTMDWGESNVDEIVEHLELLYRDRDKAREIGNAGRSFISRFSWQTQIGLLDQLLSTVI